MAVTGTAEHGLAVVGMAAHGVALVGTAAARGAGVAVAGTGVRPPVAVAGTAGRALAWVVAASMAAWAAAVVFITNTLGTLQDFPDAFRLAAGSVFDLLFL